MRRKAEAPALESTCEERSKSRREFRNSPRFFLGATRRDCYTFDALTLGFLAEIFVSHLPSALRTGSS